MTKCDFCKKRIWPWEHTAIYSPESHATCHWKHALECLRGVMKDDPAQEETVWAIMFQRDKRNAMIKEVMQLEQDYIRTGTKYK